MLQVISPVSLSSPPEAFFALLFDGTIFGLPIWFHMDLEIRVISEAVSNCNLAGLPLMSTVMNFRFDW